MYYIIYGSLYLVSLLPLPLLYLISDFIFFIIFYFVRYRREIVFSNLTIAFPEKSLEERKKIARHFYRNFVDTFIETIKLLSMSNQEFDKRCNGNFTAINQLGVNGKSIQLIGGHMFNWEFANLVFGKQLQIPFIGIYGEIKNSIFNRLFLKIRSKYGTQLISTRAFKASFESINRSQYSMYLLADQNPTPNNNYWMNFFSRPVPFITGPFKAAAKNNLAVVFINFRKIKRGYYTVNADIVIEHAGLFTPQELTKKYRDFLEKIIRHQPENYLWSHRRWRYDFKLESNDQWIED